MFVHPIGIFDSYKVFKGAKLKRNAVAIFLLVGVFILSCERLEASTQYFDSYEYKVVNSTSVTQDISMETFFGMNSSVYFNVTNANNFSVYVNTTSYDSSLFSFIPKDAYIPANSSKIFYAVINTSYIYDASTDVVFNITNSTFILLLIFTP